jgi:hypothetical protein
MQEKKSTKWSIFTASALSTAIGAALSTTVLTVAPVQAVQAQGTCAPHLYRRQYRQRKRHQLQGELVDAGQ